jgi:hypothetical protein
MSVKWIESITGREYQAGTKMSTRSIAPEKTAEADFFRGLFLK